jgi:8-oxo-dGTP pyrophosphatase MutT (NUDIX family)
MSTILEKVTAFVTRPTPGGDELLLFQHPHAGIQIPAGTVEEGEAVEAAALREAQEETGLEDFTLRRLLATADDPLPPDHVVTCKNAAIRTRPEATSWIWTYIRRGIRVQRHRQRNGFSQITYQETERQADADYVTFQLTGWVADDTLTLISRRYFYHLEFHASTPASWVVHTDQHDFTLFWAPLTTLPAIHPAQRGWLRFLAPHFPYVQFTQGETEA